MVAKISHITSLMSVLIYNQNKVRTQDARVVADNRMVGDLTNIPQNVMQRAMQSFEPYLAANRRTEKPVIHISLNPSPEDRLTDEQLASVADDYMQKMGYGDQPYVVYLHEDTGRRHIHIVSTCVDENGRKIDSAYEWRRSMQACRELEAQYGLKQTSAEREEQTGPAVKKVDHKRGDVKQQVGNTLKGVLAGYKFQSFGEYSALLACFNIEAKMVKGEHNGQPYTGIVYTAVNNKGKAVGPPLKSSLFGKQFGAEGLAKKMSRHAVSYKEKKWGPMIQGDIRQAMYDCGGRQKRFENLVRGKGLDVVFRKNDEGRIYGVTFIDHRSREVYNGSRLGKEFSANAFETLFTPPAQSVSPRSTPEMDTRQQSSPDGASLIEQVFGVFPSGGYDDVLPDDDPMLRRKRKKKKPVKKQGHGL